MASGGGVGDGEEEICIGGDRVYFISTYLEGGDIGAEEDHGEHNGGHHSKTGLSTEGDCHLGNY
jgi:hypothetical protein